MGKVCGLSEAESTGESNVVLQLRRCTGDRESDASSAESRAYRSLKSQGKDGEVTRASTRRSCCEETEMMGGKEQRGKEKGREQEGGEGRGRQGGWRHDRTEEGAV